MLWPFVCQRRALLAITVTFLCVLLLLSRLLPSPSEPPPPSATFTPRGSSRLRHHAAFEYLLNAPVCDGDAAVRAVVVVHSDTRHPEVREAIRESLPADELRELGISRAFMVADASQAVNEGETTIEQSAVFEEHARHGDLVQGNFHDSYHNLTYKHLMALDWATTFCPQARYIVKMDDDIVYNVYELVKVLPFTPQRQYLGGHLFPTSAPYRGDNKWRVGPEEWPGAMFPPYVSGWLYIVSQDVARRLVLQSSVVPLFWIDDLFITGMLAEQLPVSVRGLNSLYATRPDCVRYTVRQQFPEDRPAPHTVFAPEFVVAPSGRDLEALKAFNRLSRYCQRRPCILRRQAVCDNHLM